MTSVCPRLFEAEALRDGRLSGAELVSFQRHLTVCAVCAREVNTLEALANSLRGHAVERAKTDELHVRRERVRLLAAFDASLAAPERAASSFDGSTLRSRAQGVRLWLQGAAVCALLAAILLFFHARPSSPADAVVVRADSTAIWSRQSQGGMEKIVLRSGALSIRVDHALAGRRLVVELPDGELEDIGTTFAVSADQGRTTRVTVQEGSVVLRIHGQPPLAIGAGDSWTPPLRPVTPACTECAPLAIPSGARPATAPAASATTEALAAPSAAATAAATRPGALGAAATRASVPSASSSAQLAPATAPSLPSPSGLAAPSPPSSGAAGAASLDFREAMAALANGENAHAASRFGAFLLAHPRDRRSEDAAYLRVLALQRAGNAEGTRQAAREYLRRFPRGFRRSEVERLSR